MHATDWPDHWKRTTLGVVLDRSRERIEPVRGGSQSFFYVGLEHIESETGRLVDARDVLSSELRSTKNVFQPGDILYGKLRPNLNKIHLATASGVCSTDIWVLQPRPIIDIDFAVYYLRSRSVVERVTRLAIGGQLPRISSSAFDAIPIPIPPLPEQRRIVAILRLADELRQLRRRANERAKGLLPALFHEMFGDPFVNPRGWPLTQLGDLLIYSPQNGLYKHNSYYGHGTPIVRIANFYEGRLNRSETFERLETTPEEIERYRLHNGNVLINRVNSPEFLGKSALVAGINSDTVFESNMMRLTIDENKVSPEYVVAFLNTDYAKVQILRISKRAINQASINQQDVMALELPVPPSTVLNRFTQCRRLLEESRYSILIAEQIMGQLYMSLVARAFTGELTTVWREVYSTELAEAAEERDRLLGATAHLPRRAAVDLDTEAGQEAFAGTLDQIMVPSTQQLLNNLGSTAALVATLQESPFAQLGHQLREATQINANLVNAEIFRSVGKLAKANQIALAQAVAPIRKIQTSFAQLADTIDATQRAIQSTNLAWALQLAETAASIMRRPDPDHPRFGLLRDLSENQYATYVAIQSTDRYATAENLAEEMGWSAQRVAQNLTLLAAAGLVQSAALPTQPTGDQVVYVQVYRALQPNDDVWSDDLRQLAELSA